MLSNREITENFEVQINTLYNWRKTKPKLYKYLRNADYNFEQTKEINVLLKRLAQDIRGNWLVNEIKFFVESEVEAKSMDDIENIEKIFILRYEKVLHKDIDLYLSIYNKLHSMTVLEKYIFYKRAHNIRAEHKNLDDELLIEYFEEFLND